MGQEALSLTHVLTLDFDFPEPTQDHYPFFLNVVGVFFPPEETLMKLITIGM